MHSSIKSDGMFVLGLSRSGLVAIEIAALRCCLDDLIRVEEVNAKLRTRMRRAVCRNVHLVVGFLKRGVSVSVVSTGLNGLTYGARHISPALGLKRLPRICRDALACVLSCVRPWLNGCARRSWLGRGRLSL